MTNVRKLTEFPGMVQTLAESKDNPEEWYVLIGQMCGEYSVQADSKPDGYEQSMEDLPPEEQDATENVDGFMQIGMQGWTSKAFKDGSDFVGEYGYGDKVDTRLLNLILVHEDMLTEEALAAGKGEYDDREEVEA